jgi:hypothetical protein
MKTFNFKSLQSLLDKLPKGPWHSRDGFAYCSIGTINCRQIARPSYSTELSTLIAAIPEMMDELRLLDTIKNCIEYDKTRDKPASQEAYDIFTEIDNKPNRIIPDIQRVIDERDELKKDLKEAVGQLTLLMLRDKEEHIKLFDWVEKMFSKHKIGARYEDD